MSATAEELLTFLRRMRNVREYTSEPVSEQTIQDILEVGRWSGSGGNRQPAEVLVVRDSEVKKKMGDWGARPAASAAVVLLIVMPEDAGQIDEGRLGERLMLGAWAQGLGAGMATLKNEGPEAVKPLLGIPAGKRAQLVVAIGHIDRQARRALPKKGADARKPMPEFAHWERY